MGTAAGTGVRATATAAGRTIATGTATGDGAETPQATEARGVTSLLVLGAWPRVGHRVRPIRETPMGTRSAWLLAAATAALVGVVALARPAPQEGSPAKGAAREISVSARRYVFEPAHIEVQQDDLVKIKFTAEDIAHSFTVDKYRIAKRAGAGQTVTFEFRADQPGTFTYYCNLAIDEGCRKMKGELVVKTK
jgi:cytochrome c oxidase subunit 2